MLSRSRFRQFWLRLATPRQGTVIAHVAIMDLRDAICRRLHDEVAIERALAEVFSGIPMHFDRATVAIHLRQLGIRFLVMVSCVIISARGLVC